MTTNKLTDEQLQEIYGEAVSCELAEKNGAYMASFDLLCKMDDVGGTAHVVRKLIDMLRAERVELQERRKADNAEPVFFIEVEGDDWIQAGRIPGSTFDFNNLPDGINKLYAVPQPAPDSEAQSTLKRLAVILHGSEVDLNLLTVTAQSLMDRCKAGNSPVIGIDLASEPDRSVEVRYLAPPGYVMVPKEPTNEMLNAWLSEIANWRGHVAGYKAMLAAAPLQAEEPAQKK